MGSKNQMYGSKIRETILDNSTCKKIYLRDFWINMTQRLFQKEKKMKY